MDAVLAFADNARDFVEACITAVVDFERTAGPEPEGRDGEKDGVEDRLVGCVEGAVEEDVLAADVRFRHELVRRGENISENHRGDRLFDPHCFGVIAGAGRLDFGESIRDGPADFALGIVDYDLAGRIEMPTGACDGFALGCEDTLVCGPGFAKQPTFAGGNDMVGLRRHGFIVLLLGLVAWGVRNGVLRASRRVMAVRGVDSSGTESRAPNPLSTALPTQPLIVALQPRLFRTTEI